MALMYQLIKKKHLNITWCQLQNEIQLHYSILLILLDQGDGVPFDKEEAAKYYKLSITQGNSEAMFRYSCMLLKGEWIKVDKEEALKYLKMSANKDNENALRYYSNIVDENDKFENIEQKTN